jgi:hypothetical protein
MRSVGAIILAAGGSLRSKLECDRLFDAPGLSAIDHQKIARHREQHARRTVKVFANEEKQNAEASLSNARIS